MLIDWKNPEPFYAWTWQQRFARLQRIRQQPDCLPGLRLYYSQHPWDFISDWGVTHDPRVVGKGRSPVMPFVLFPKQIELAKDIHHAIMNGEPLIVEKSREVGASWVAMAMCCTYALLMDDVTFGFGSQIGEKVDNLNDPNALFPKGRMFIDNLPAEFKQGWKIGKDAPHMRMVFPETGSSITGSCGDAIGRGGRTLATVIDESAWLLHPELVDASLSANTECRIDISSVNGMANPFAQKRHAGNIKVFTLHYRDDPRKDEAWKAKKFKDLNNNETLWNQEFEIDYSASAVGIVIPSSWARAAVDAHLKLPKLTWGGQKFASMDVGDTGDRCAAVFGEGNLLRHAESWSGSASNIYKSTEHMFRYCDKRLLAEFVYDGDGLGAGVRGDAENINLRRKENMTGIQIAVSAFRGSAAGDNLWEPDRIVPGTGNGQGVEGDPRKGVTARNFFKNYKAQGWWMLRYRFENTWKALNGQEYDADWMISICSGFAELDQLVLELSQPVYYEDGAGKIVIDKTPEGVQSPNLGDGTMMRFAPRRRPMRIHESLATVEPVEMPAHWR